MSSKTTFKCDFCSAEVDAEASFPHGNYAMCRVVDMGYHEWSTNLNENMKGPHICGDCIEDIVRMFNRDQLHEIHGPYD